MSHGHGHAPSSEELSRSLGAAGGRIARVALTVAAVGLIAAVAHAAVSGGVRRFALAYLAAAAFTLSLSLGALFFVFIQHLTRAGWSVLLRRVPEAMSANLVVAAALLLPVLGTIAAGSTVIYPWAVWHPHVEHHDPPAAADHGDAPAVADNHAAAPLHAAAYPHQQLDELTLRKRAWLNPGLATARWAVFLLIWSGLGWWYWRQSRLQESDPGVEPTRRREAMAGPTALIYALTVTLAAADLIMSLNPHSYSSALGVYFFSGCVVGALATVILVILGLQRLGVLTRAVGVEHQHDLGKLLFAFVFFWAYIAYSQYLLLWYAHLPETRVWLAHRGASMAAPNGWSVLLLVLLAGHFVIPFAVLMSRHVKRARRWLAGCAGWLLVMHWLDLVWLVMPEVGPGLALGLVEVGLLLAVGGVYVAALAWRLGGAPLVPVGDPRLAESLGFENI